MKLLKANLIEWRIDIRGADSKLDFVTDEMINEMDAMN